MKRIACVTVLLLVISGCASPSVALQCPQLPPPPAWVLESPPSLMPLLNRLISPSETVSPASKDNLPPVKAN